MKVFENPFSEQMSEEVRNLFLGCDQLDFFCTLAWYEVTARHAIEKGWHTRLYTNGSAALVACVRDVRSEDEIRGFSSIYATENSTLLFLPRANIQDDVRALICSVAKNSRNTKTILIPGLDPTADSFSAAILGMRDAGFLSKPYVCWETWFEPMKDRDFNSYLTSRPSQLLNTWRRKKSLIEKAKGGVVRYCEDSDIERFILDYEHVYQKSWKSPEPFPNFIPALIRRTHREGVLRYGTLEWRGKVLAAQFWIVWKGRAVIFKLAYDEEFKRLSPGTILTMEMIRNVISRDKPNEINFGRGNEHYKSLWMSKRRQFCGIEAANPRTLRGLGRGLKIYAVAVRNFLTSKTKLS